MPCSAAWRRCSGSSRRASRPGVELGVQRLDAAVHDLREAGEVLDAADLEPGRLELARGAAGRDHLDAELGQAAGEVDDAALVGDRQQRAADADRAGLGEQLLPRVGVRLGDAASIVKRRGRSAARRAPAPRLVERARAAGMTRRDRRTPTGGISMDQRTTDPEHDLEHTGDELEERLERLDDHIEESKQGGVAPAARRTTTRSRTPRATGRRRRRRRRRGPRRASTTPRADEDDDEDF